MNEHSVDITPENAQQLIIEESAKRPVLVDFWADWCAPCKNLGPVLEKLADEYAGQFLLAKINADEQQMLAAQFGVQSLPTVMVVKDGQPVDGFAGAKPEGEVREMLDKYLPKPWELAFAEANALAEAEQFSAALSLYKSAYDDSKQRADIAMAYARCLLALKRLEECGELINAIGMVDQDADFAQLKAQWELACEAGKSPELEALEAQHEANRDDTALALTLGIQYAQSGYTKEALELLISLLRKDLSCEGGDVKKAYTDVLQSLEKGDALAAEYQRKLYTLLY